MERQRTPNKHGTATNWEDTKQICTMKAMKTKQICKKDGWTSKSVKNMCGLES